MCAYKLGGLGNDSLQGTTGADTLLGAAGDDTLYGLGGVDSLDGGSGNDLIVGSGKLIGGTGNDTMTALPNGIASTFYVDSADDVVNAAFIDWTGHGENVTDFMTYGNKVIYTAASDLGQYTMPDNVQVAQVQALADVGIVGNAQSNYIVGNAFTNFLDGDDGNDTIDGGGGLDIITGGLGNDSITGSGFLVGAEGNDILTVSGSMSSVLSGDEGDDKLIGGDGDDSLIPGDGSDTMDGGNGNDAYLLSELDGTDFINDTGTTGRDTVQAECDVNLTTNMLGIEDVELQEGAAITAIGNNVANSLTGNTNNNKLIGGGGNDTLLGLDGNDSLSGGDGNDSLDGGAGKDTLDGGTGTDTMVGGDGNDLYIIDSLSDVVTEVDGQGTRDSVRGALSFTVMDNVEYGALLGSGNFNLTGRATVGTNLSGNLGNNYIKGGSGTDRLYGGAGGIDTLAGGDSGDFYVLDEDTDVIIEDPNADGFDVIFDAADTLHVAEGIEYVMMTGVAYEVVGSTDDNTVFGSEFDNVISGGDGMDDLNGYAGNDTLAGNAGNDSLYGGVGNDTYLFSRGDGADMVSDVDATVGNNDTLAFSTGISYDQLWFTQSGNNLNVGVIGSNDSVQVQNFFADAKYQVETITAGGKTLTSDRVAGLVSAMAGLTPPAAGQTTLTANYQTQLVTALTTAWK